MAVRLRVEGEPDAADWVDEETAYLCQARRHKTLGHWCGYVAVPLGHPLHGAKVSDRRLDELQVHGGITYANAGAPGGPGFWFFGFDCAHAGDLVPFVEFRDGVYRNLEFVRGQLRALAKQLSEVRA